MRAIVLSAVPHYQPADGRRRVIFMDEFWKRLRDPVFKDFAYNKLKTIRKLNGMLVVVSILQRL